MAERGNDGDCYMKGIDGILRRHRFIVNTLTMLLSCIVN